MIGLVFKSQILSSLTNPTTRRMQTTVEQYILRDTVLKNKWHLEVKRAGIPNADKKCVSVPSPRELRYGQLFEYKTAK